MNIIPIAQSRNQQKQEVARFRRAERVFGTLFACCGNVAQMELPRYSRTQLHDLRNELAQAIEQLEAFRKLLPRHAEGSGRPTEFP
jgi:hypothetical protein